MLAEIIDKMPTISQMWFWWGLIGVVLAAIGLTHRRVAYLALLVGLLISVVLAYQSYYEAFADPTFSHDVQTEMGTIWIVNSLLSTLCPALFTMAVVLLYYKRKKSQITV